MTCGALCIQDLPQDALERMAEFVQPKLPLAAPEPALPLDAQPARLARPAVAFRSNRRPRAQAPDARRRLTASVAVTRAPVAASGAPAGGAVLAKVAAIVATVLGSDVGNDQPLMTAGLDSLGAVELRNALAAAFGTELLPTVTLDYPTVSALAGHIAQLLPHDTAVAVPADTAVEHAVEGGLEDEVSLRIDLQICVRSIWLSFPCLWYFCSSRRQAALACILETQSNPGS